jgi:hypothetical protein
MDWNAILVAAFGLRTNWSHQGVRRIFPVLIALLLTSTPIMVALISSDAIAQTQRRDNRTLLQRLFGVQPRVEAPRARPKKLERPRAPKKKATTTKKKKKAAEAPLPVVQRKPKSPEALKIVVVGDLVAEALASGLEQSLADDPSLTVVDASDKNAGLISGKAYDGSTRLPAILNEAQPHFVVLAFGTNDRLPIGDAKVRIKSDGWKAEYERSIAGIVETLHLYGRPFLWVSAPPMRSRSAMQDMTYLNSLYRPHTERMGGHFVDIWEGFVSASGSYVASGPDAEGQTRQLRTGDGINFTRAGKLKLAFYVEREIRRVSGLGKAGMELNANLTRGNRIEVTPDGRKIRVGPVLSLTEPVAGTTEELVGSGKPSVPARDSAQYKAIVLGKTLPAVPGRADDFSWDFSKGRRASAPITAQKASAADGAAANLGDAAELMVKP